MPTLLRLRGGTRRYASAQAARDYIEQRALRPQPYGPGVVLPRTVLISPVVDVSLNNPQIPAVEPTDPWLSRDGLLVFAQRWRGDLAPTDPRVSPIAADLTGLGALTIFSGTRDILNPDARLLTEKATAAGVDVDYHERRGLLHVYPLTPTPEGRAARAVIVEQLAAH